MPQAEYSGQKVEVNAEGFLVDAGQWNRQIAAAIAAEAGLGELNENHWKVIDFCRKDAAEHSGQAPGLRRISQLSGVGMKDLYALFPKGPGKLAAKVAGLPKPQGCI